MKGSDRFFIGIRQDGRSPTADWVLVIADDDDPTSFKILPAREGPWRDFGGHIFEGSILQAIEQRLRVYRVKEISRKEACMVAYEMS